MPYIAIACRVSITVIFAIAAAGKLSGRDSFREFTRSVVAMQVVPPRAAGAAAGFSAAAELLAASLAVIPLRATGIAGCALAGLLAVAFSFAITVSLRRGNRAPCRCFGKSATPLGGRHIARNALILAISVAGIGTLPGRAAVSAPAVIVAAAAGLFIGLGIAAYDEIGELIAPSH